MLITTYQKIKHKINLKKKKTNKYIKFLIILKSG